MTPPKDAIDPLRDFLRRHGLHALLLDAAASACSVLPAEGADPVPWIWPEALDGLRRCPAALLVGRHGSFLAEFAAGTLEMGTIALAQAASKGWWLRRLHGRRPTLG